HVPPPALHPFPTRRSSDLIEMQHVPYRGAGPAYPDLMTGKVDVFFDNLPGSVELVKSGKLRALGVTQGKRNFVFPDLPSIGETVDRKSTRLNSSHRTISYA